MIQLPKLSLLLFLIQSTKSEFTLMQISDFHLDVDYSRQGDPSKLCHAGNSIESHAKAAATDKLGQFGDYMCDSPLSLVENAVQSASKMFPDPNLILWTGDNVPHIEGYSLEYLLTAINKTTAQLKKYYPNAKILPTYGNHDHSPSNRFEEHDEYFYNETYKMWKKWIGEENKETFLKGAYYKYQLDGTKFLVLNTNYYYQFNQAKFKNPLDPTDQFKFMVDELEASRKKGEPVNVVAHIAPGMYERKANFSWFRDAHNARFLQITNDYKDTIKMMIFGHHHTDTFHVVRDSAGNPTQILYMCPAVTPWYSDLGDGANNPAFRIYKFDSTKSWEVKDIETYYVNLTKLNNDEKGTQWQLEYSFKDAYGLKDFSPKSFDNLVDRIGKDNNLYQKYLSFNGVLSSFTPSTTKKTVKDEKADKVAQVCSLRHADYVAYRKCIANGGDGKIVDDGGKKDDSKSDGNRAMMCVQSVLLMFFGFFNLMV